MQPRAMRRAWRHDIRRRKHKTGPRWETEKSCTGGQRQGEYMMETETKTDRYVRVTIEGPARTLAHNTDLLRVDYGGHVAMLVDSTAPGVMIEDTHPPRFWMDGDVVLLNPGLDERVCQREQGSWLTLPYGPSMSDVQIDTALVTSGVVLRCQSEQVGAA